VLEMMRIVAKATRGPPSPAPTMARKAQNSGMHTLDVLLTESHILESLRAFAMRSGDSWAHLARGPRARDEVVPRATGREHVPAAGRLGEWRLLPSCEAKLLHRFRGLPTARGRRRPLFHSPITFPIGIGDLFGRTRLQIGGESPPRVPILIRHALQIADDVRKKPAARNRPSATTDRHHRKHGDPQRAAPRAGQRLPEKET